MNKAILIISVVALSLATHTAFAADDAAGKGEKEKSDAMAAFKAADTNGDGGLSRDELAKTPESKFQTIKANFDQMDANKDGKVTTEEQIAWTEAQRKAQFEEMDTNHDGKVTPEERNAWIKRQRYLIGK